MPLFFGIFTRFGNKQGAITGMLTGIIIAIVLTVFYPDDIPALGSLTSGIVGLGGNVLVFLVCGVAIQADAKEKARVNDLFEMAEPAKLPLTKPVLN
ncbi:hypothetical protein ABC733_10235 [Mangrovibacter sp. SLW1]